jgi:hypothetical protein
MAHPNKRYLGLELRLAGHLQADWDIVLAQRPWRGTAGNSREREDEAISVTVNWVINQEREQG